jgi:Protein of unknown function (DUF3810)
MKFKRKLVILAVQVALLGLVMFCMPRYNSLIPLYDRFVFCPIQSLRDVLFGFLPFSIGDIIYIAGGAWLLVTIVRWMRYIVKFRQYKMQLAASALRMVNTVLFVYLFFIFGWGANYYKVPLRTYWHLGTTDTTWPKLSASERRIKTTEALIAFDTFLVEKLNNYAPHFRILSFREMNVRAENYYRTYSDSKLKRYGLGIKPTMFGYFMEGLAVEGYYNPFTGEGQINRALPGFTMPFLICHEMAHQAGIAAEGDANLLAYALCTTTEDSIFRYSAYLNIWLYTNNRLYRRDSVKAKSLEAQLNKLTTKHMDTLEQLSRKYDNDAARYSSELFDRYLKMQDQKEGIRSYGNVAGGAWQLELDRIKGIKRPITIP